jgi:hypothetical protein
MLWKDLKTVLKKIRPVGVIAIIQVKHTELLGFGD